MSVPSRGVNAAWWIERVSADDRYRFTNLADHTAWQVNVHCVGSDTIAVPGHVGYARGSFELTMTPGRYWLTWQITPAMLPPRGSNPARNEEPSTTFELPLGKLSHLEIARLS